MTEQLPPELQHQLMKYQQLQDQLARVLQERAVVEAELREAERVLRVLEDLPEDSKVYRSIGMVLVVVDKEEVRKEYSDKKDILELRLKKLKEQEDLLRKQLREVQDRIKGLSAKTYMLGAGKGSGG